MSERTYPQRNWQKLISKKILKAFLLRLVYLSQNSYSLLHLNHLPYQRWHSLIGLIDTYTSTKKKWSVDGIFDTNDSEDCLSDFLEENDLHNLVKFSTCFKCLSNASTIDLIIGNKHLSFQNKISVSTGSSDFHKMVFTSIKTTFQKAPPKVIIHHDMKWFDKSAFKSELAQKYTTKDSMSYLHFENTFMNVYGQKLQIFQKYSNYKKIPSYVFRLYNSP